MSEYTYGTVQQLVQGVAMAIAHQNGTRFAEALQQLDLGNASLVSQLETGRVDLRNLCGSALDRPYDEMLVEQLHCLLATHRGEHVKAYGHQEHACQAFQQVFEKDTSWALEAMHALDLALRRAAIRADAELKAAGKKPDKLPEAANLLQKSFKVTVTDRAPLETSKKWGALHVINNLFKIYFQLNNLRLCQNLIRAVEGPGFPKALDGSELSGRKFPAAQLVTYHYFVGRLSLLNSQFAQAEKQLSFSFERCPAASYKNKRLILRYLVPVRLVLGVYAAPALLRKYDLPHFVPLCRAVDRGDIRLFERQLDEHQHLFIKQGSYLLVERAKTIAYRNFFRRVHGLHLEGTTKLDVAMFKRCLDATGISLDHDEIECVLANLIYKGYIKGYLSHQHGKLVVGKANSFPPLRSILG